MTERRDRRVVFFLVAAIVCFALVPPADEFWYVGAFTGVVYTLLAIAAELDAQSRRTRKPVVRDDVHDTTEAAD